MRSMVEWLRTTGSPAPEWIAWARSVARRLYLAGDRTQKQMILSDGTLIYIQFVDENAYILVTGGFSRFPYLSGLQEHAARNIEEGTYAGQFYPCRETDNGITREWYQYSTMDTFTPWPLTNLKGTTAPEWFTIDWVMRTRPVLTAEVNSTRLYPSMFTGKMRRVVQKMYGRRLIDSINDLPFHTGCGIFIPADSEDPPKLDIKKQRWVIEVVRDAIYTYPIKFFDERIGLVGEDLKAFSDWPQSQQDRYDYGVEKKLEAPIIGIVNSLKEWDELPDKTGYKIQIANKEFMDDLWLDEFNDDKTIMSNWYAPWAFDYSGRKACAVLIGRKTYSTGVLYHSTLYEISFEQDDLGRPKSVKVDVLKEDYLRTWCEAVEPPSNAYHPLSAYTTLLGLATRIFWDYAGDGWSAVQPDERDSPVYAFYNLENELVLLSHHYKKSYATADEIIDPWRSSYTTSRPGGETYSPSYGNVIDDFDSGYYEFRDNITRELNCYTLGRFDEESVETSRLQVLINEPDGRDADNWLIGGYGDYPNGDAEGSLIYNHYLRQTFYDYRDYTKTLFEHIGIPRYEREGVFFYRKTSETTGASAVTVKRAGTVAYTGTNGRWRSLLSPTLISTHSTGSFTGWVYYWQGPTPGYRAPFVGGGAIDGWTDPEQNNDNEEYYYLGSIKENELELDIFPDAYTWFNDEFQLYDAANGAFSGTCMTATYGPSIDYWKFTADYPLETSYAWEQSTGLMVYPTMAFIGDETTEEKTNTKFIDIEAVPFKERPSE